MSGRRPMLRGALLVLFVLLPLAEVYVIVQVGQAVGVGWTILLLALGVVLGAWLIRHQGARAWRALREAVASGRTPAVELADGALVLIGGTLLMVPGFITDALGALVLLPFTRPLFGRLLGAAVARRMPSGRTGVGPQPRPGPGPEPDAGPVVRGEVVDDVDDD